MNFFAIFLLLFLISSKKFHANTKITDSCSFIFFLENIGILTPGTNFPCFKGLSSTIKSISFLILK